MNIKNVEELVPEIKRRLVDYLSTQNIFPTPGKPILCFAHNENTPSMYLLDRDLVPKMYCQGSCKRSFSTFDAYAILENKNIEGDGFVQAVEDLSKRFNLSIRYGIETETDKARRLDRQLVSEIADMLDPDLSKEYMESRNWLDEEGKSLISYGSADPDEIRSNLIAKGWDPQVVSSRRGLLPSGSPVQYIGQTMTTFVIRDYNGNPIAFNSRQDKSYEGSRKWINTPNTTIFTKKNALMGIDVAVKTARTKGLYLVEGLGEVLQLNRIGISNVAAVGSANLSAEQLRLIKKIGIRRVCIAFDWDKAGQEGIQRAIDKHAGTSLELKVLMPPEGFDAKDLDEYLIDSADAESFNELKRVSAFEWSLSRIEDGTDPMEIVDKMIPAVALETMSSRREVMLRSLEDKTGISYFSLLQDVNRILNSVEDEKNGRFLATLSEYVQNAKEDPSQIDTLLIQHQSDLKKISNDYGKVTYGRDYQLEKFDSHELRQQQLAEMDGGSEFNMKFWPEFKACFNNCNWTEGVLGLLGGKAHHGKSAVLRSMGCDIVVNDPDSIVIFHLTDDAYTSVVPMFQSMMSFMTRDHHTSPSMMLAHFSQPHKIRNEQIRNEYERARKLFRDYVRNERLIMLDRVEGKKISVLQQMLEYVRNRYPDKKLMVIQDNMYNSALASSNSTSRNDKLTEHTDILTDFSVNYKCAFMCTAEYRKVQLVDDMNQLKWPTMDELADAREVQYRPHIIAHVINDVVVRGSGAQFTWRDDHGQTRPQLAIKMEKNKLTGVNSDKVGILKLNLNPRDLTLMSPSVMERMSAPVESEGSLGFTYEDY